MVTAHYVIKKKTILITFLKHVFDVWCNITDNCPNPNIIGITKFFITLWKKLLLLCEPFGIIGMKFSSITMDVTQQLFWNKLEISIITLSIIIKITISSI